MTDSNFANIDFPRFFGSDPGGSTVIPGIQNFALTTPARAIAVLERELQAAQSTAPVRQIRITISKGL